MRNILFIVCLAFFCHRTSAQTLEGTYVADPGRDVVRFESETFRFAGQRFHYWFSSCTSGGEGSGTYTLSADTLRLRFEVPVSTAAATQGIRGPIADGTVYTFLISSLQPSKFTLTWPDQTYKRPTPYRKATAKEIIKWRLEVE